MHTVRVCSAAVMVLVVAGCGGPSGAPTLQFFSTPSIIFRGAQVTLRVSALDEAAAPGTGEVTFQSDVGSLKDGEKVSLRADGAASIEFTCPESDSSCAVSAAKITATWAHATNPTDSVEIQLTTKPDTDAGTPKVDAGRPDAGAVADAGVGLDAGGPIQDGGSLDAGPRDAGGLDSGVLDAGQRDAGQPDAGGGPNDAGQPDAGQPDAGTPDSGAPDAAVDAGSAYDAGFYADDSGCADTWASGTSAVTYQLDLAHSGSQPNDFLSLPLCERWRHDLGATAGYPVISDNRVFAVSAQTSLLEAKLWAFEQHTGELLWGPISLGSTFRRPMLALENDRVIVHSSEGVLKAFDVATGTLLWASGWATASSGSPPTVYNGLVYAGVHGAMARWRVTDGGLVDSASVVNGQDSAAAIEPGAFYLSYSCGQTYSYTLAGVSRWRVNPGCSGGGGKTPVIRNGFVYSRDLSLVLAAGDGGQRGLLSSYWAPSFAGETAILSTTGSVTARALDGGVPADLLWANTYAAVVLPPIVVGSQVVVGHQATPAGPYRVSVLDANDGGEVSFVPITPNAGAEYPNGQPPAAFGAANGMLFVPSGNFIIAY